MDSALDHLPEFLLVATLITGVIWALDRILWRPRRLAAVATLEARTPEAERDSDGFTISREALLREPPIMEWAGSFFPVLAVVLVLRSFIMEPFVIPSGSMIPTLEVGDYILVNKYAYGLRLPVIGTKVVDVGEPQRGDVMVFFPPHKDRYFIKRVVGLPGDLIQYSNKRLIINGEVVPAAVVDESPAEDPLMLVVEEELGDANHFIHVYPGRREAVREWRVPEDHYFMMGDNRDRSDDSRGWGFVPESNIVGKAVAVWMHKEPGLALPDFGRNGAIE
ncbi:MAG TPA: signal peptidase I [Pseudomonadales bacterium]|nr:signal peptidase I [Pseudomonadales bacterium]